MMLYLLKTVLAMALFLGIYHVFLEQEKMFRFNRFYLLLTLIASLTMPFWISSTEYIATPISQATETPISQTIENFPQTALSISTSTSVNWIGKLYIVGLGVMLIGFLFNCGKVIRFIREGKLIAFEGAKLVLHTKIQVPFSFLHFIFLPKKSYEHGEIAASLLKHEQAHVKQAHSLDNILVELIHCLCWFNPLLILYKRAIRLNHEFLADEAVLHSNSTPENYMHLLIQQTGQRSHNRLTSSLTYGKTKKRLNMMLKQSKNDTHLIKQLFLLPVFLLACWMFGQSKTVYQEATPTVHTSTALDEVFTVSNASQDPELLYDLDFNGKGGMMAYYTIDGKSNARRVKASIGPKVKVSFTNQEGAKVSKLCQDLTEKERNWFWKLDQSQAHVFRFPHPQKVNRPTEAQMKDFLNPKEYGVWLDGVRVENSVLRNYRSQDIHHIFKSSLMRNAAHYGQYTYQVNLYTQIWFDKKHEGKESGWWEKLTLNGGWYYIEQA